MQAQPFQIYAAQFFSRSWTLNDVVTSPVQLVANDSLSMKGQLSIRLGAPLLEGPGDMRTRPTFTPLEPYPEAAENAIGSWLDPYAEIRWPECALAHFYLDDPEGRFPTLDVAVQCDLLQALRTLLSAELVGIVDAKASTDQFVSAVSRRYSFWTPAVDSAGNPLPVPTGDYIVASSGEPIGPGFAALRGVGRTEKGLESCSLALVWSQSFSVVAEAGTPVHEAGVAKRAHDLQVRFNSKEDLKRADACLLKGDMRGCIASSQVAVESALRFYCSYWGARFPSLPGIDFQQRIERLLKRVGRVPYGVVDPAGLLELEHLYRASLKAHDGECSYRDDQLRRNVVCEGRHAQQFLDAAIRFTFWLDSQA